MSTNGAFKNKNISALLHRSCGVIFVLTLLSLLLIAAVVFYVLNVGKHVQERVVTQNAADTAVIAGTTEITRTFNTIAMNNVQCVRNLALINILDSVPQALDYTITSFHERKDGDLTALHHVLEYQYYKCGPNIPWYKNLLKRALEGHPGSTSVVLPKLHELNEQICHDLYRHQGLTNYNHPKKDRHGDIWESIYAMSQQNQTLLETLNERMQIAASEAAGVNMPAKTYLGGLILPAELPVPIMKGHFSDFERPLKRGLLPGNDYTDFIRNDDVRTGLGDIDDPASNRGPWDTLFGWRDIDRKNTKDEIITTGIAQPPRRKQYYKGASDGSKYNTYGPQEWMIRKLFDGYDMNSPGALHPFDERVRDFSSYKLDYLFSGSPQPKIRFMYKPNWEVDLVRDDVRMRDHNDYTLKKYYKEMSKMKNRWEEGATMYLVCEMKSRFTSNPGLPATQGKTWNYVKRNKKPYPYVGYVDKYYPNRTNGPEYINDTYIRSQNYLNDYVYRIKAKYLTDPNNFEHGGDSEIGLQPRITGRNPDGTYTYAPQTVFWEIYYVFIARDFHDIPEGVKPITNPHNGFEMNLASSPAPYDFVHHYMTPNSTEAKRRLQFLSVAYQDDYAEFWPERFDKNRLTPKMVSISQARIFNNHSWDLWTQMWHTQLEPISDYAVWMDELGDRNISQIQTLDHGTMSELSYYLKSVKNMAKYGRH
ncbi:hypothetical protein JD969_06545 [Planctomycetota bacterium]|nr:hypothetical protein JD969_06545 [Planctomycetota bacterium]